MGRIKSTAIKRLGDDLIQEHADKFSTDFEHNKKILDEVKKIESKKMRNVLAGYITRRMQQIEKTGL